MERSLTRAKDGPGFVLGDVQRSLTGTEDELDVVGRDFRTILDCRRW
jgi:hypothetical protein